MSEIKEAEIVLRTRAGNKQPAAEAAGDVLDESRKGNSVGSLTQFLYSNGLSKPILAGLVTPYSNQAAAEALVEALYVFSTPRHLEYSLEELEKLYSDIQSNPAPIREEPTPQARNAQRRLGPERVKEVVEKYAAGRSSQSLGKEYGVGPNAVLGMVRRSGGVLRNQPLDDATAQKAVRLYESGLSLQRVADRLQKPKMTIRRELLRRGVVLRSR